MKKIFYLKLLFALFICSYNVQSQVNLAKDYDWRDDPYEKELVRKRTESAKIKKINRAVSDIKRTSWGYTDYFKEAYSSFIESGSYFSNRTESYLGSIEYSTFDPPPSTYLVLNMNGNQYIYKNVPYNIWEGLKNASSKGGFYNYYIKGNYGL